MTDTVDTYRIAGNCRGKIFSQITGYSRNIINEYLVFVDKEKGNSADSRNIYSRNPLSRTLANFFLRKFLP